MSSIFKFAALLNKKYAVEHHGIDPDTGERIVPKFENGDLVRHNGKVAIYITKAHWEPGNWALIQFKHKKISFSQGKSDRGYDLVPEGELELVQKKNELF